jgi:siroheme synthase (precorrin-2 oxidase/ferrochelatase)
VIRADDQLCFAFPLEQLVTAMFANIIKSAQLSVRISTGNNALALHIRRNIATGFTQLLFVAQKLPAFMKNLRLLNFKEVRIKVAVCMQGTRSRGFLVKSSTD